MTKLVKKRSKHFGPDSSKPHTKLSLAQQKGFQKAKKTRAARIARECTPQNHATRALSAQSAYCPICGRQIA